ncbi:hypothetical protein [Nocardioides antri]|nr:hypothetical protein [Nocardioides antri]
MNDAQGSVRPALEMRWVPVADEEGRTHVQAVWIEARVGSVRTPDAA